MNEGMAGALASVASMLFFGSYAVPIRMPSVMAAHVDPVVFQTYKSFACFATSWLVLLYVPLRFTWWGFAGAGLWVMTGIGAITAVRLAGIGTAQSLWSGLSIFVSYIWGAYFFDEPIRNHTLALVALAIMAIGMIGVGSAASGNNLLTHLSKCWTQSARTAGKLLYCLPRTLLNSSRAGNCSKQGDEALDGNLTASLISDDDNESAGSVLSIRDDCGKLKYNKEDRFIQGVVCAVFVGVANGSVMIPLKYANQDVVGVEYLVSFGVGAMVITTLLLATYSLVLVCSGWPCPCFQFRVAAGPALLTGVLWSIGNYCSIYATLYMGMSLGWPLVQCQLLVSAMWAVFYYEEVSGQQAKTLLIGSSVVVVGGAVMLSQFGTSS